MGVVIGPFSARLVPADRFEDAIGERRAARLDRLLARVDDLPLDVDARRRGDEPGGVGHLRADPVPGDQRDFHHRGVPPARSSRGGL